jgi:hypothetical protein
LIELENNLRRDMRELEYRIIIKLGGLRRHRLQLSLRWLSCFKFVTRTMRHCLNTVSYGTDSQTLNLGVAKLEMIYEYRNNYRTSIKLAPASRAYIANIAGNLDYEEDSSFQKNGGKKY